MMTHFPHKQTLRSGDRNPASHPPVRPTTLSDILWGRPVFRAPALANPRVALDPLPFTAARITQRARQG